MRELWWHELLVVLGLTGFAVSQPMLSLLGENPTVLTFHGVDGPTLVGFALALALLPPLVLWAIALGTTAVHQRAGWVLHLGTVALLASLTLVQVIKAVGLDQPVAVAALALAGGLALAWAYNGFEPVATWLQFTAVLPAIALFLFLFASPSSDLVGGRQSLTAPEGERNDLPSVVVIVLDEFPTTSILDGDDDIDEVRFPNLARFADDATWYPRFTSVAPVTKLAVPALLTGNPPRETEPLWTNYPDNLFSLLAPTHDLVAFETATELCGLDTCTEGPPGTSSRTTRLGDLISTTADLYRERVSPGANQGERLDTFEEAPVGAAAASPAPAATQPGPLETEAVVGRLERVDRFIDALHPRDERPALFFLHLMLPHSPWRFYDTGETYDAVRGGGSYPFSVANDQGEWVASITEQRHLLQAQYTDQMVGDVIDELKVGELYDESLIVVVADHGISFEPNTRTRELKEGSDEGIEGLAYSPLFIKLPGQADGAVDQANLMAIDLLPTIAEQLEIEIPFEVEGVAAGSTALEARGDGKVFYDAVGQLGGRKTVRRVVEFVDDVSLTAGDRWIPPIDAEDQAMAGLYRAFDLDKWIGQPLDPLLTGTGGVASVPLRGRLEDTPSGAPPLGLVTGRVEVPTTARGVVVAAVDGQIVAASPLHDFIGQTRSFTLFFPPGQVEEGREVRLALIDGDDVTELDLVG